MDDIIALNALVMLNKIRSFPSLLPNSIVATITTYSPEHGSTHNDCEKMAKNLQHSYLPKLSVFQGASVILYHKFC